MKLTSREKSMLLLLIVVSVLTLSFKFLIVPSIESINSSKVQLTELDMLEEEMNITIEAYSNIDDKIKIEYEVYEKSEYIYENIDDTFVDNLMQNFVEGYYLQLTSLSFGLSEDETGNLSDISSLLNDIINQKFKIENSDAAILVNKNLDNVVDESESYSNGEFTQSVFYCNINVIGNLDNVMNMVNDINNYDKSIIVTSLNGSTSGGIFNGSISVKIYYVV